VKGTMKMMTKTTRMMMKKKTRMTKRTKMKNQSMELVKRLLVRRRMRRLAV
jgi:hypothetical protein